jgi:prepilin signal peptidase PulO-like enzyme (type II secretory pathway)
MEIVNATYTVVGLLGLVFGSFAGASVWRLRARQLTDETRELDRLTGLKKSDGELSEDDAENLTYLKQSKVKRTAELKRLGKLAGAKTSEDRSQCLECSHMLGMRDLVPLFSWISTRGKCRYCGKKIGRFEPLIELGTAATFLLFAYFWIGAFGLSLAGILLLVLWLAALTMLVILFVYDLKWFLLPDKVVFPLIALSAVIALGSLISTSSLDLLAIGSLLVSVGILGGLYFVLWFVSKGRWVGFGDVKLGLALGLLLMDWRLAFLTLFLANLIGTLVVLPGLITKKMSRTTQVPFGPLLIVGFFVSMVFGQVISTGYEDFTVWLSGVMLML